MKINIQTRQYLDCTYRFVNVHNHKGAIAKSKRGKRNLLFTTSNVPNIISVIID